MSMATWIGRLVVRPLKADGRWLFPILLSASIALASLVPVEALHQAGEAEFGGYCAGALGADMRIEVNSLDPDARLRLSELVKWAEELGALIGRVHEITVPVKSAWAQAPVRIVMVDRSQSGKAADAPCYPFYGGNLWSRSPETALSDGLAMSTNALKNLGVSPGDDVTVGSVTLRVAASFPESVLSLTASGSAGSALVAADKMPLASETLGAHEIVVVKYPTDPEVGRQVRQRVEEMLGKAGVLGSEEVAPVIEVGLARLKQVFFWCSILILFMCVFGLAFGIEDYMNSKGDEIATLKVLGFSPTCVGLILISRLALAGLVAGIVGAMLGWSLAVASAQVVEAEARSIAKLLQPSVIPWHFLLIGPTLVLTFGAVPLLSRLLERPHHVLWSKMRGFPLAVRTGAGVRSLLSTLALSVPVTLGLARWYCGPGQVPATGTLAVLLVGVLTLVAVALMVRIVSEVGKRLSVRLRWAFTYLSIGRGRLVASAGAIAFALSIASTTVLLDNAITWEVQAAVRRQVPFSVCALAPQSALTLDEEADVTKHVSSLRGVYGSAWCDVGWAYVVRGPGALIKAPRLDEAALFGSSLAEHASTAPPGLVPCTIWEERARTSSLGRPITITMGSSASSGPQGRPLEAVIVWLDPKPGLRVGLNAPLTVPEGVLDMPIYRYLGVQVDPAYTFEVAGVLRERLPEEAEVHDLGPIEVMLRSAAEELSFVWRAVAFFALLVSLVTYLTTSSVSRLMRSYEIALMRTLGVVGWRLRLGPFAEALTQGVISGTVGASVAYLAVYKGLALFINVDFPMRWELPIGVVAISVLLSLCLQTVAFRASLGRSALETLRSE